MTTALQHPAVLAYLEELRTLLDGSPERDLVLDGVTRHIEDEIGAGADVRAVLDDLGDPAAIAAEAAPTTPAAAPPARFLERRAGSVLVAVLVAVGGVIVPFAGWVVGIALLWLSKGWTRADKVLATVTPFAVSAAVVVAGFLRPIDPTACSLLSGDCVPSPADAIPLHLLLLLTPLSSIPVGIVLLIRFRPRR